MVLGDGKKVEKVLGWGRDKNSMIAQVFVALLVLDRWLLYFCGDGYLTILLSLLLSFLFAFFLFLEGGKQIVPSQFDFVLTSSRNLILQYIIVLSRVLP